MKIKGLLLALVALFTLAANKAGAHAMHLQVAATGKAGVKQTVKVFFAEDPTKWEPVNGHEWAMVAKGFEVMVVSPEGKTETIKMTPMADHYMGSFVPRENGKYTVLLKNEKIGVLAFPKQDPFIPYFYAKAVVDVTGGKHYSADRHEMPAMPMDLVFKKGAAGHKGYLTFANQGPTVMVNVIDTKGQENKVKLLDDGEIDYAFNTPGKYIVEVINIQPEKGTAGGKEYASKISVFTTAATVK